MPGLQGRNDIRGYFSTRVAILEDSSHWFSRVLGSRLLSSLVKERPQERAKYEYLEREM